MNKKELINFISENGPGIFPLKKIEGFLDDILNVLSEELVKGGSITLVGFGTFKVVQRKAKTGRNPQNGETIKIPPKKVVLFKPSKTLKEKVL